MLPTPLAMLQAKVGWVVSARPNWSRPCAVNCCVAPVFSVTLAGVRATVVNVWRTVTVTLLVTVGPPASRIVTRNVYLPAWVKVAVLYRSAFVRFAEKIGVAALLGLLVTAQV